MSEKREYETAVEEFVSADRHFEELKTKFMDGSILFDLSPDRGVQHMQAQMVEAWKELAKRLEDRNAKLTAAKNAMRQAVVLAPTQWRGPEGQPTVVSFSGFSCSSVTKRTFDPKSLLDGASKHGLLERLLALTGRDKNGQEYKLVQQVWEIDYDGVKSWLQAHGLSDVLEGAYDEKEGTPQAKGPKLLAFLGEVKEK
jgi:hypothetical protein